MRSLIGPFSQIVTMNHLPFAGSLFDAQMEVLENGAILVEDGIISEIGSYDRLQGMEAQHFSIRSPTVCFPGFIDCHTHICYAGNRSSEYAQKLQGLSYQDIARNGGGILSTVAATRKATFDELLENLLKRADILLSRGITTCEVKSGYGLNVEDELKMLRVIKEANEIHSLSFIPTCLAAHIVPKEFSNATSYLEHLLKYLLPIVAKEQLAKRVDIFVENGAFSVAEARSYLLAAREMGFDLVIHGDQFSSGGAALAADIEALSVDHLEHITQSDALLLARSNVIPVVLPGASLGLGEPLAPARMLLDNNLPLVIGSDWNPGSAPMGDLLTQSAILGMQEKITMAETFAAITYRAAAALRLPDRGILQKGMKADFTLFPTADYRDVLYQQGAMKPLFVFKEGNLAYSANVSLPIQQAATLL